MVLIYRASRFHILAQVSLSSCVIYIICNNTWEGRGGRRRRGAWWALRTALYVIKGIGCWNWDWFQQVVQLLLNFTSRNHHLDSLISNCTSQFSSFTDVKITHVARHQNKCANTLAKEGKGDYHENTAGYLFAYVLPAPSRWSMY